VEESQCRLDDGTGTGIVVEEVKTMLTSRMIQKRDRDVALTRNADKLINLFPLRCRDMYQISS
jgi:hypothetical protein